MIIVGTLDFAGGFVAGGRLLPWFVAQGSSRLHGLGASSASQVRMTLYFGLARPKGPVTEPERQIFLRDEVTEKLVS